MSGCDLLENSYLCGISNNKQQFQNYLLNVVICLKIRTFVVSATTVARETYNHIRCDLLENSYLCGISNNYLTRGTAKEGVVICLKIRTFVVSATTYLFINILKYMLWFAWKFVPVWYQQQRTYPVTLVLSSCDLLENSYLCGISNNLRDFHQCRYLLWFAWKFVPLWYQQQRTNEISIICIRCDLLENSYLCGISNNKAMGITYW